MLGYTCHQQCSPGHDDQPRVSTIAKYHSDFHTHIGSYYPAIIPYDPLQKGRASFPKKTPQRGSWSSWPRRLMEGLNVDSRAREALKEVSKESQAPRAWYPRKISGKNRPKEGRRDLGLCMVMQSSELTHAIGHMSLYLHDLTCIHMYPLHLPHTYSL